MYIGYQWDGPNGRRTIIAVTDKDENVCRIIGNVWSDSISVTIQTDNGNVQTIPASQLGVTIYRDEMNRQIREQQEHESEIVRGF